MIFNSKVSLYSKQEIRVHKIAAVIVMVTNPAASAVWVTLFLASFFVVTG
ncbi:MAG: hypothetical protein WBN95_09755 [Gammaproteobacteria bacterium]